VAVHEAELVTVCIIVYVPGLGKITVEVLAVVVKLDGADDPIN